MGMMETLGVDEDTPIDAKMLSNAIENAQKQGGVPQLPDPQERPGVRRRDEHPA